MANASPDRRAFLLPFSADDVRRILEAAILDTVTAPPDIAPKIAAALAPRVTGALLDLAGEEGDLMTASEALFVRDAVAKELEVNGGPDIAERLIRAGFIDVGPILDAHRQAPQSSPATIGALTGPIPVPSPARSALTGPTPISAA